jgi:tetratricopeptide (TPR) repeat protein
MRFSAHTAEIARIEGRNDDAMRLYEEAIRSARDNGFVHNEGIAYERASACYRARGFDQFADLPWRRKSHRSGGNKGLLYRERKRPRKLEPAGLRIHATCPPLRMMTSRA